MIEVQRKQGGFAFYDDAHRAIGAMLCELLMFLRDTRGINSSDGQLALSDFADRLNEIDASGLMRSYEIGPAIFRTAR